MKIILENIGRRFNREWIFRNIDFQFEQGLSYAVLGPNGSGKSTLLQLIAGSLTPSAGSIEYLVQGFSISTERFFSEISMTAPYLELVEELSLVEHIDFHFKFKNYRGDHDKNSVVELLKLHNSENKAIKYFSSGMKQRLKLALSFCSDTPVLLLDEPTSNLDMQGVEWYLSLIEEYSKNRLVVISSNQKHEYDFCSEILRVEDYKTQTTHKTT